MNILRCQSISSETRPREKQAISGEINVLNTNLIVSGLCNVPHPPIGMIAGLVVNTKEADVDSTGSKHGNLKFSVDRRSAPWFRPDCWHQIHVCLDVAFCLTGKALDPPHNSLLFWFVLGSAKRVLNFRFRRILGHGDLDDNVSSKQLVRKIRDDLQIDRYSVVKERDVVSDALCG